VVLPSQDHTIISCNVRTPQLIFAVSIYNKAKSICHTDGTAGFDSSGAKYIICLLQVCYHEFMCASVCSAKRIEGESVELAGGMIFSFFRTFCTHLFETKF